MILRALYSIVTFICIVPIIPGLLGVLIPALGYIPPIGLDRFSLNGFMMVFAWEGVWHSLGLTLMSAIMSTYLACLMTFAILQACWGRRFWRKIEWLLSPLLAMPHVAFAIGFTFIFAPTGMGTRALSTLFSSGSITQATEQLPLLVQDPYALGLTVMLALKEVPFLLLMSISVLQQLNVKQLEKVSASLGYNSAQTWWKCIFPQWIAKLRFPILAVMAYGLSVVDVALILGPTNPPTFAVLVWQWFTDPNLDLLPRASAGAILLFLIALMLIGLVRGVEWLITKKIRHWQYSGRFGVRLPGKTFFGALLSLAILMVPLMLLWSFSQRWRFPDLLPSRYTRQFWLDELNGILSCVEQSLIIALISAFIALVLAIIAHEYHLKYRFKIPGYVIAIPMLLPQLSLLFGLQVTTLSFVGEYYFLWVCWAHVFFAFPFVYLALDGAWQSFDCRLIRIALSLGKSPLRVWITVKMPLLMSAIVFAWAVGMSVSLAQYLPTLILGAGRISTITTEAVALSGGFDRRIMSIYAVLQAVLPLFFFLLSFLISKLKLRHLRLPRKGLVINDSLYQKPQHL